MIKGSEEGGQQPTAITWHELCFTHLLQK